MPAARHILAPYKPAAPTSPPVSSYAAWFDASQIAGAADNTALATWLDLSGNHNDLTQTTPSQRPTYYSSTAGKTVNGRPAVWFVAASMTCIFRTSAFQGVSAADGSWTAFLVAVQSVAAAVTVMDGDQGSFGAIPGRIAQFIRFSPFGTIAFSPAVSPVFQANGPAMTTGPGLFVAVANPSTLTARLNGIAGTPLTTGPLVTSVNGLSFGGGVTVPASLDGAVCEALLYPSALTGPQVASTESYLKTKWGTP